MRELAYEELQELVFHYAVYVGWPLGRHLDDLLVKAAKRYAMRYPDPKLRDQLMAEGLMRVEGEGDMSRLPRFWLELDTTSLIRPRTAW